LADNPQPEQARKVMEERQLLGRLGDPNEIAAAVVFLVRNSFVTGSALVVDGGMTAR
jgi:NAD(P)-dependent dehydrogenase (short-subunit alcohol dehydrogenase family)